MLKNILISVLLSVAFSVVHAQMVQPLEIDTTADKAAIESQIKVAQTVLQQERQYYQTELKAIKKANKTPIPLRNNNFLLKLCRFALFPYDDEGFVADMLRQTDSIYRLSH